MSRKKKAPVVQLADRDEAAAVAAGVPAEVSVALDELLARDLASSTSQR